MKNCTQPIMVSQVVKAKETLVKRFSPSSQKDSEEFANQWLVRNAGKVKIYEIVTKRTKGHIMKPRLEIIYKKQVGPPISSN